MEKLLYHLDAVHPGVRHIELSAKTGEGIAEWRDWLVQTATRERAVV
jgi:Ni2+-binding GTPase involved in maturation of urease and hydrogenase